MNTREERLAWLARYLNDMPGTGVIYCLTVNDCKLVANWLSYNGIECRPYYADLEQNDKQDNIKLFMENKIKALSATVAFGMGYDKADISFVVHFQRPGNIVAYYQQIGRAGRQIPNAYAVLLYGEEDDLINEYFINSAFPTPFMMNEVISAIKENPGIKKNSVQRYVDLKTSSIEKSLKYLEVNGDIYKEKYGYYKTPKPWIPDTKRSEEVTAIRKKELQRIVDFSKTSGCYMQFIAEELDDRNANECGKCANCIGEKLLNTEISREEITSAQNFIREDFNVIIPRKQWPDSGCSIDGKLNIQKFYLLEEGRVLCNYGDAGWGREVQQDKYVSGCFRDELIMASCKLLKDFVKDNDIRIVTYVPSLRRPNLVKEFAEKLARKLSLEFVVMLEKSKNSECQKNMNNSFSQWKNANESFKVIKVRKENILLVDDMVDSKWTFTCCGYKLREAGSGNVYPFALANSAGKGNNEDELFRK